MSRMASVLAALVCVVVASAALFAESPEPPHNAGYRRIDFALQAPGGKSLRRNLDLWYPTAEREERYDYKPQVGFAAHEAKVAGGKHPLIVFSHGFLGSSDQTIFLMEACARQGYVVASMNHADARLAGLFGEKPEFGKPENWSDEKYRDRRDDIVALLDQLLAWNKDDSSLLNNHLDAKRIGGMGHSLGGYTMLGLAGGWKLWYEPRIRAAVLLSPYSLPYTVKGDVSHVQIPVMLQGGTLDFGITPFLPEAYRKLDKPKYYLVLKNETHFGWTNLIAHGKTTTEAASEGNAELIVRYTVAFFDQHLRGRDESKTLTTDEPRLHSYKFER
jgi:predicted dienelactone hydrolase